MELLLASAVHSLRDLVPIVLILAAFQILVVRASPPAVQRIVIGLAHVFLGLTLFRFGLDLSLIPTGAHIAERLAAGSAEHAAGLSGYLLLISFAAGLGLTATMIEPALTAIATRVREMTGGSMNAWHFRLVVAIGVAAGLTIGTIRTMVGIPLEFVLLPLLAIVTILAALAPRWLVPIALDSGAVATSIVTVPMITAFGLSLASTIPGRDPLVDGFGLVLLALLLPIVTVLAFSLVQVARHNPDRTES